MAVIIKSRGGNVGLLYRGDRPNVFCRLKKPDVGGGVRRGPGVTGEAGGDAREPHAPPEYGNPRQAAGGRPS